MRFASSRDVIAVCVASLGTSGDIYVPNLKLYTIEGHSQFSTIACVHKVS